LITTIYSCKKRKINHKTASRIPSLHNSHSGVAVSRHRNLRGDQASTCFYNSGTELYK